MGTIVSLEKGTHLLSTRSKVRIGSNFAYLRLSRVSLTTRGAPHQRSPFASSSPTVSSHSRTSFTPASRESRLLVGTPLARSPLWLSIPLHRHCYVTLVLVSRSSVSSRSQFVFWTYAIMRAAMVSILNWCLENSMRKLSSTRS